MNNMDGQPKGETWKHGYGHCVSVEVGHLRLVTEIAKAVALEEVKPTTWSDASTQAAPTTDEMALQTSDTPEHQCAALQTEPLNDENSILLGDAALVPHVNSSTQTTPYTNKTATQTKSTPRAESLTPVTHYDPAPDIATSQSTTLTYPVDTRSEHQLPLLR